VSAAARLAKGHTLGGAQRVAKTGLGQAAYSEYIGRGDDGVGRWLIAVHEPRSYTAVTRRNTGHPSGYLNAYFVKRLLDHLPFGRREREERLDLEGRQLTRDLLQTENTACHGFIARSWEGAQ
jgi:hypothetical protein